MKTKYFGVDVTPDEMRALEEIEGLDDETLRANQDCRSPHDQWIISLVRQKKTHDKDKKARAAGRVGRLAATAPARTAAAAAQKEKTKAERARAPPPTRAASGGETPNMVDGYAFVISG